MNHRERYERMSLPELQREYNATLSRMLQSMRMRPYVPRRETPWQRYRWLAFEPLRALRRWLCRHLCDCDE